MSADNSSQEPAYTALSAVPRDELGSEQPGSEQLGPEPGPMSSAPAITRGQSWPRA